MVPSSSLANCRDGGDVFLESQEKGLYAEDIVKGASKQSGPATEHLCETPPFLVSAGTIQVAK